MPFGFQCASCQRGLIMLPIPDSPLTCTCGAEYVYRLRPGTRLSAERVQTERPVKRGATFIVLERLPETADQAPRRYILCFECGRPSFNPNDVEQEYCGFCHQFHEFLAGAKELAEAERAQEADDGGEAGGRI